MPITFDSALIVIVAAFDLWLIVRFFANKKQVIVRGTVPSRAIMLVLICAVVVIQASRGAFTKYALAFNIGIVLCVFLIWVTPTGISKEGLLAGVFPTMWMKIYYYEIEPYSETKIRLRAHLATNERNLVFDIEKKDEVEAHLIAAGVLSFLQYKDLKNKRG